MQRVVPVPAAGPKAWAEDGSWWLAKRERAKGYAPAWNGDREGRRKS